VVLVRKHNSQPPEPPPVHLRVPRTCLVRHLGGRLSQDLQQPLGCPQQDHLRHSATCPLVNNFGQTPSRPPRCRRSGRHRGSHRHRLAVDVLVAVLQPTDRPHVHLAAQQCLKIIGQANQIHKARPRVELDQEVDVTGGRVYSLSGFHFTECEADSPTAPTVLRVDHSLDPARVSLADMVTVANGVAGFLGLSVLTGVWAIDQSPGLSQEELLACLLFYALGMLFDLVDGPVARRFGSSGYGSRLDAICDTITFGLLPGMLLVVKFGEYGSGAAPALVVAGGYVAATIIRLARQSWLEQAHADAVTRHGASAVQPEFTGMPSPVGGNCVLAVVVLAAPSVISLSVAALVALLLVARFPYPNNKTTLGAVFVSVLLALSFVAIAGLIPLAVPCIVTLVGLLPIALVRAIRRAVHV
jgi:CDP-diacylglycerol---serine O-phosphatidyltransferase